jgi:hypothetical protein
MVIRMADNGEDSFMPHYSATRRRPTPQIPKPWYPEELPEQLQSALSTLADIECRRDRDQERLSAWKGTEAAKRRMSEELKRRYDTEREPLVKAVAALHQRMLTVMAYDEIFRSD